MRHVEVEKQPELKAAHFQVREYLGTVHRQQFLHTLDFDDEALFDNEGDAISIRELNFLVNKRKTDLVLDMQAGCGSS